MNMRTKENLISIGDTSIFYQYLYMNKENSITFDSGVAIFKLFMEDSFTVRAIDLTFPNAQPIDFSTQLTLLNLLSIIEVLKKDKNTTYNNFNNKWEEIKTIVLNNLD